MVLLILQIAKFIMTKETYTVSLEPETAERLKTVAATQNLNLETALTAAITDYLATWEDHLTELDDEPREDLPWLRSTTDKS